MLGVRVPSKAFRNVTVLVPTQRLYTQAMRQRQYTNLRYAILTFYKFCTDKKELVHDLKGLRFSMASTHQNSAPNHQLLIHLLFFWFTRQAFNIVWSSTADQWQAFPEKDAWFYMLRHKFLPRLSVYPFVPTPHWSKYAASQTAILPWDQLLGVGQLPECLEDYYELAEHKKIQLSFSLKISKANELSKRYNEIFFFRAHHYPTACNLRTLKVLHALSFVPLRQPYLFDDLVDARYSSDVRKKQMLFVYRHFYKLLKHKKIIFEYQIYIRIKEQFNLAPVSVAADTFFKRWWQR